MRREEGKRNDGCDQNRRGRPRRTCGKSNRHGNGRRRERRRRRLVSARRYPVNVCPDISDRACFEHRGIFQREAQRVLFIDVYRIFPYPANRFDNRIFYTCMHRRGGGRLSGGLNCPIHCEFFRTVRARKRRKYARNLYVFLHESAAIFQVSLIFDDKEIRTQKTRRVCGGFFVFPLGLIIWRFFPRLSVFRVFRASA